ncbi:MAG: hypothetical protein JST48_06160 [Bacteroidetes bacterium]|nr:hypothetical protein [Bacteroidota bacterium]
MAKKNEKVKAFQFVFEAEGENGLMRILETKPKKVLFTVSIETEVTKDNRKVGALKIEAVGTGSTKKTYKGGDGVPGCPVPPCNP